MAPTKKTARKSTGGKAPRKQLATKVNYPTLYTVCKFDFRQHESRHHRLEASRSRTDTDQVPLLFVKSVDTRNRLNYSSESFPSNDSSVKSLKTSKPISDSNLLPLAPSRYVRMFYSSEFGNNFEYFRKPQKPSWLASSKMLTCAQLLPSV